MTYLEYLMALVIYLFLGFGLALPLNIKYYSNLNATFSISDLQSKIRKKHFFIVIFTPIFISILFSNLYKIIGSDLLNFLCCSVISKIFIFLFILIFIKSENLIDDFFKGRKFIKLGVLTYIMSLPWVAISALFVNFVTVKLLHKPMGRIGFNFIPNQIATYPLLFLVYQFNTCFIVPVYEEIIFRGFVQNFFSRKFSSFIGISIILSSLLFTTVHYKLVNEIKDLYLLLPIFISSIFIGFLYHKTRSLTSCIVFHVTHNLVNVLSSMLLKFNL